LPQIYKGEIIEKDFECYDKNNKLIYKYDKYFDDLDGGTSPLILYGMILKC